VKCGNKSFDIFGNHTDADAHLCFIESHRKSYSKPMFQRLDGIYFNNTQNYNQQNRNIKRTYDMADGVIFQSNFNKELTFKYFGPRSNYTIIHNGADVDRIAQTEPLAFNRYENLWSCASSWRPHKRLSENIRYFLTHGGPNDGMIVAGDVAPKDRIKNDRVHYVGNLKQHQLYALYKKSKYFVHLAWLDHCPNVVVDARASGCQIICSSAGGTKEIAGDNAIVIAEPEWDMEPVDLYSPPDINFSILFDKKCEKSYNIGMNIVVEKYLNFIKQGI
jgi:glycosyltransferase involved in cell wall biosynthesis